MVPQIFVGTFQGTLYHLLFCIVCPIFPESADRIEKTSFLLQFSRISENVRKMII